MRKILFSLIFLSIMFLLFFSYFWGSEKKRDTLSELKRKYTEKHIPSVIHSKLTPLQRKFGKPQEVTLACIGCHTERHREVMKTAHWNWERAEYIKGRGVTYFGKKNAVNNFCIGIGGNETSCNRCHAGYGWKDNTFDFKDSSNIDCLVCHDNSGSYIKGKNLAGYPDTSVDLRLAAQSVGLPKNSNCGSCHFFGGGGNNVKHGDLEKSLFTADRNIDVHLALDGVAMECVDCHTAENHQIKGKMYSVSSMNRNRVECEQCHTAIPHGKDILNEHTYKVACQTCHIPEFAKVNATKMFWDWSKAGRLKDGKPIEIEDEDGNETYLSIKGEFKWEKNVHPEYTWFNGTADHYFPGDKVDTSNVIKINTLFGEYEDKDSKIIPVKIHRSRQIYDIENKILIQPKLFAEKPGEGGYWQDFDWDIAAKLGMKSVNEPYSGKFCFVNTQMSWPVNHMVAPKEQALKCEECHTRSNGRMMDIKGFYMPARDYSASIDTVGFILIILVLGSALVHGGARIVNFMLGNKGERQ